MAKVLENWDVASLYPNLVRIYGYSSRNQKDKKAYTDLLEMRIKAKHGELTDEFLQPLNLTNDDLKTGLKLPLNAYTGTLRAPFNALYDNLQGFSICSTGQMLLLQLAHDLKTVPTVEIVELNTDAVQYMIEEEYIEEAHKILQDWQDLTGLELEQDKIKKMIMRDVNNYVEIVETKKGYDVHYKGSEFRGNHIFKWNSDRNIFEYSFKDNLENNSLTIVSEAMIKYLLFNIPVEETIEKCNDVFRFQMISHLGHTYEKCILKYPNGDEVELQRNNRIYAGAEQNGCKIYKVKPDGRYDSLANCPVNPIVDNDNKVSIEMINKKWYNKYTKQRISDFMKEGRVFMEEKLDKLKKDELIELVKEYQRKEDNGEMNNTVESNELSLTNMSSRLLHKINDFRKLVRERNFILDMELPNNLGATEYASIEQYYQAVQEICLEVGLDFSFETEEISDFQLAAFKPSTGAPQNIATVNCLFTLTDIDTGCAKTYNVIAQGSDSIDKAVNGATTYAFRNWFNKNFSPCIWNGVKQTFGDNNAPQLDEMKSSEPKTNVFVSHSSKEAIKEEIVSTPQKSDNNNEDIEKLTNLIYEYREKSGKEDAGKNKLDKIVKGEYSDSDILSWTLSFQNAIEELGE